MSVNASAARCAASELLPALSTTLRLTYAVAPPNQTTSLARRREIAAEQSVRIAALPVDAVLVYDVQDEAARTLEQRPFAFVPKVDPLAYAFDELRLGSLPRIVYRAVAGQDADSLRGWADALHRRGGLGVLVGAPSRRSQPSLPLLEALALCGRHAPDLALGGVLIPERHQADGTEPARVWSKIDHGCRFFVSQTVWSVDTAKRLLHDLCEQAELERRTLPPVLLTFSPCGSPQTLSFIEWLGVAVPTAVKRELVGAPDMLARSVELAAAAFAELASYGRMLGLHVGCNVESVTARAAEQEASTELLRRVHRLNSERDGAARLRSDRNGYGV